MMKVTMRLASLRSGVRTVMAKGITENSFPAVASLGGTKRGFRSDALTEETRPKGSRGFNSFVQEIQPKLREMNLAMTPSGAKATDVHVENFQPPNDLQDPANKWKEITVEMWRDAVYTNQTYFGELIADTAEFVKTIAEHIKLGGRRVSMVEVGCGTGEFIRSAEKDFRTVVGVDFNKEFIDFCKEHDVPRKLARTHYLQGDACQLYDLLRDQFPTKPPPGSRGVEFWDDTRVVACVGNTIGIIPEELRQGVYEQMAEVAGKDGVLIMVYWNARWFGDACLNFYHANPKLCGPFEGEAVDFRNTTLTTPMKYKTKWTSVDEARELMENAGLEIISLREKGKGVLVAARRM